MADPKVCTTCGEPHGGCRGHNRAGKPCRRPLKPEAVVCHSHGGSAPQVAAAAERRRQERAAVQALESFGVPIVVDPTTALLTELHRTAGAVEWLGAIVGDLDRDNVTWGLTKIKTGGDDGGVTEESRPNIWYELWARERKHLVEVAKACVVAGIEERRIALAEAQGRLLAGVVSRILDRLQLTSEQRQLVAVVVPEEFRAIESKGEVA